MRMTSRKNEILSYFAPGQRAWLSRVVGPPPLDATEIAYLLCGPLRENSRHWLESVRRTLKIMVKDGLLEEIRVRELRQTISGTTTSSVVRYGVPGEMAVEHHFDNTSSTRKELSSSGHR